MTSRHVLILAFVAATAALMSSAPLDGQAFDLLVRGGLVLDGTGNPAIRADVGVRQGEIVADRDRRHGRDDPDRS